MKTVVLNLLLLALICAGCTTTTAYNIRLTTGEVITARGKPSYDEEHGIIIYTDSWGHLRGISRMRVTEVTPSSLDNSGSQFKNSSR